MSPPRESEGARRRRERERTRGDDRLFLHLGAVHGLDEDDLALLEAIAAVEEFTRRSTIFVRPSRIARSPDPERWSETRVAELRRRLGEGPQKPASGQGIAR